MHNSKQHKNREERLACKICREGELQEIHIELIGEIAYGISEGLILGAADIPTDSGTRQQRRLLFKQAKAALKKINKKK